ncbi:MAG TPA: hypothetical protein VFK04_12840 [Gemmatimonadaceae bacterium]|nr:hypothetical protein [Gemmatimonadaceae bacterium]
MDFSKLANLQRNIAADVWPNGAFLECDECRSKRAATTEDCGRYLKHGWPMCCGQTMKLTSNSGAPNA